MDQAGAQGPIVVIDDDYGIRFSCQKILVKAGFQVHTFEDGALGLEGVARLKPALVVVDLKMPGISGMEVIVRVRELNRNTVVLVITGYATIDTAVEAMKSGAYDFLPKPFTPDALRLIVNRGLEYRRLLIDAQQREMEREILRRRFITFVSHQLQTPLVAVHQYLDVLSRLEDTPEVAARRREWIDRCLKRTEELQSIIRDWLTLAKLESGTLARQRIAVDVKQVVLRILETYQELARADEVQIEARMPDSVCFAVGDPNCIGVLFDNLIVNAIKYNKPGGRVTVTGELSNGEVVVSVVDTGVGIPENCRARLFEDFFRVEGEGAAKTSGTGLGLAICKRIIAEMGGSISVESEVGSGSTFRVSMLAWREQGGGDAAGGV
jgi:signal transduction histidine kinase